jgi:hypothetical protein
MSIRRFMKRKQEAEKRSYAARISIVWTIASAERYYNDVLASHIGQIFAHNGSFPMLQADSSRGCQNRGDANEVVGSGRENEEPFNQVATTVPSLAEATNSFQPAERLLRRLSPSHSVAGGQRFMCCHRIDSSTG